MDFFILHKFCSESATRLLDPKNVFELLGEADAVGLLEVALNALDLDGPVIPSPLEFTVGDAAFGGDASWLPHGHLASVHLLEDLADFSVEGWFVDDLLLVLKFVRDHRNHYKSCECAYWIMNLLEFSMKFHPVLKRTF